MAFLQSLRFLSLAVICISLRTVQGKATAASTNAADYKSSNIITRDVCVIGGGSSGTYTAIRLRQQGKSVAVIEAKNRLGGHTETYVDPFTGATNDIGVVAYENTTIVQNYFKSLNVALGPLGGFDAGPTGQFIDFKTGRTVEGYSATPDPAAFQAYAAQLSKYPYILNGFNLPNPVPEDLVLPFGKFVEKYKLQGIVSTVFQYGQGIGDLLNLPTLYPAKLVGLNVLGGIASGFVHSAKNDNSLLYEAATKQLGADALLSSRVLAISRSLPKRVAIAVATPQGPKLILAKKLVVAVPPLIPNLEGFDLSSQESTVFRQFGNGAYYTGLLNNTGLPAGASITNAAPNTPYNLPQLPATYVIRASGDSNIFNVYYGATSDQSVEEVQQHILADLARIRAAADQGSDAPNPGPVDPKFVDFSAHVPFELTVSAEKIKGGFYGKLEALQGQRRTYYTGAAFDVHESAGLWAFTEGLLSKITAGL